MHMYAWASSLAPVDPQACPNNFVTTLDLTRPNMRFIMAESISASQIIITLQAGQTTGICIQLKEC